MLTNLELQFQLTVILSLLHLHRLEQLPDAVFCQEGAAKDSHNFIDAPVEFKRSFNDSNSAVRGDSHINLYSYSILCISPEGLNAQVSLHPFKEGLYNPSIFIKECNILGLQVKVVRIVSEGTFEFRFIIYDSSDFGRIMNSVPLRGKPYSVIYEDIIYPLQKILSIHHIKLWPSFFPYYEERVEHLDMVQPFQIPVATVKDIAGEWLVFNPVHRIHIMHGSFCDIERYRYLGNNINLSVHLDARLGTSKSCPLKKGHTQVNGCGVKSIVLPVEFKFLVYALLLSKFHQVMRKTLKNMIIKKLVCFGKYTTVNWSLSKTKVVRFICMCRSNIGQFTKAVTTVQLPEHKNEHLIPVGQIPTFGFIIGFCINKPFKISFWEKVSNLTENVSAFIHARNFFGHQYRQPIQMCDKVFGNIHPDILIVRNDFNRY